MSAAADRAAWVAGGRRVALDVAGARREMWVHAAGDGPELTALHGFPGSSWEWAGVAEELERAHRLLAPDLLGFGESEKPDVRYTVGLQADVVEALWRVEGIASTALLACDYGAMVVMELLARRGQGRLAVELERVVLLNAGLFSESYRPRRLTRLTAGGPLAPVLGRALSEKAVTRSWSQTFSAGHALAPEVAAEHWRALAQDGERPLQRMLHFVPERHRHARRWDEALVAAGLPLHLVWGPADLVSGGDAGRVPSRLPHARLEVLDGLGHAPHLEEPARVGQALRRALSAREPAEG